MKTLTVLKYKGEAFEEKIVFQGRTKKEIKNLHNQKLGWMRKNKYTEYIWS